MRFPIRFLLVTLLAALLCWASPVPAQPKMRIAILEFDAVNDTAKQDNKGRMISEKITTEAAKSGLFDVVERHMIQKILDENQFGTTGHTGSAAQQIGHMVGANAVLTGSVTQYKGDLTIDARLVSVDDGSILMAEEAFAKDDLPSILTAARQVFRRMVGIIAPPEIESQPQQPASHAPPPEPKTVGAPLPGGPGGKWFVIVGSYPKGKHDAAVQRMNRLAAAIPGLHIISTDEYDNLANGLYALVVGPYAKDDAQKSLEQVRLHVGDAYMKAGW